MAGAKLSATLVARKDHADDERHGTMNGSSSLSASKIPVSSGLYSGVHLCRTLDAGARCFRILEYSEGVFEVVFHEHVPRHRISSDNAFEFMKALTHSISPLRRAMEWTTF